MDRKLFFSRCYFILIGLAVLSVPFTSLLYFFITPLLLILWIIEGDWKRKWNTLKTSNIFIISGAFLLFWFINVIGIACSDHIVKALMRTYDKLPFLVYPLVFFTLDANIFKKEKLQGLFKGFLCATTIMILICWGNASIQYMKTCQMQHFYYIYFSELFGHPAYCAAIVCIAFCIAFSFLSQATQYKWLWVVLLFFFGISIYFFQTKSGTFTFILLLFFLFFFYLQNHKKEYLKIAGLFFTVILFSLILVEFFPNRVDKYVSNINNMKQYQEKNIAETLFESRIDIWKITCQIALKYKMFGIGTGYNNANFLSDTDSEVIKADSLFMNTHNQFLQTFLEHGIMGLSILSFLIFYSFFYAIKTKNYLLLSLLIIFLINIFFESMFERHKGIFTFCLFYGLFIVKNNIFASCINTKVKILKIKLKNNSTSFKKII